MDTLKTLRDEVLSWLDESGNTSTTKTNVDNALNDAHQRRLTAYNWPWTVWPREETITLVANQQYYSLNPQVDRIIYLRDVDNDTYLKAAPYRGIDPLGGNLHNALLGDKFHFMGMSPVASQPSSSSVLTIVSTSAADTGATYAVTVRGETTTGVRSETINPNGTTPAVGSVAFTRILNVTLAAAWAGTLTMTSNTGTVTNLTLNAGEVGRQYPQIFLTWVPDGGEVIGYKFFTRPRVLSADNDIPDIPFPYTKILVYDALLALAAYNGQMDGGRVALWQQRQVEIERNMTMNMDPGIAGSVSREVRMVDEY